MFLGHQGTELYSFCWHGHTYQCSPQKMFKALIANALLYSKGEHCILSNLFIEQGWQIFLFYLYTVRNVWIDPRNEQYCNQYHSV